METSTDTPTHSDWLTHSTRLFSWGVISVLLVYLINNYLNLAHEWPGAGSILYHLRVDTIHELWLLCLIWSSP